MKAYPLISDFPTKFYTFRCKIPSQTTMTIDLQPQHVFKPHTLRYNGKSGLFRLKNFKVGKNDQFFSEAMFENFRGPKPEDLSDYLKTIAAASETLATGGSNTEIQTTAAALLKDNIDMLKKFSHNLGPIDTVQISMFMTMVVENVAQFEADFECLVYGYNAEGW